MLEKRVLELEGVLGVTRNANSLLEQEIDNLQQYQRHACIIVNGISPVRARLDETQSELKPVWHVKPLWNVVLFTWQFTWRFHCDNFPNISKTLLHMCKWYLLINVHLINAEKCFQWLLLIDASLINAKQMLRYWLFFKQ